MDNILLEITGKTETERKYQLARDNFYEYCRLKHPKFYKSDRPHLKQICDILQGIYEGTLLNPKTGKPYKKLMLNIAPRHGKSFTVTNFCQWVFGRNIENKIISATYNDTLAQRFGRGVRDGISESKIEDTIDIFSDVFPGIKLKDGDASSTLWSLEGRFFSYLATSIDASITGMGCNIGIIDDPIKNADEAFNDNVLEKIWDWYVNTYLSRLEEGAIEIIIMTRWATGDLCGRILAGEDADEWYVLEQKACLNEETGEMLCPSILSYETYCKRRKKTSVSIFEANYNQTPVDIKGRLYSEIKTYTDMPNFEQIINYTDTADTGDDYLCSICAGIYKGEAWILDVLYTQKGMEFTEPETADFLYRNNVNLCKIESNNGGRGFARAVEKRIYSKYSTRRTVIKWFHQSKNKKARILANSLFVMEHIYFPHNWRDRFPDFYRDIMKYQAAGKNKHDDAPDALTGIAEMVSGKITRKNYSGRGARR